MLRHVLLAAVLSGSTVPAVAQTTALNCMDSSKGILAAGKHTTTTEGADTVFRLSIENISGRRITSLDAALWVDDQFGGNYAQGDLGWMAPWEAGETKVFEARLGYTHGKPKTMNICITFKVFDAEP